MINTIDNRTQCIHKKPLQIQFWLPNCVYFRVKKPYIVIMGVYFNTRRFKDRPFCPFNEGFCALTLDDLFLIFYFATSYKRFGLPLKIIHVKFVFVYIWHKQYIIMKVVDDCYEMLRIVCVLQRSTRATRIFFVFWNLFQKIVMVMMWCNYYTHKLLGARFCISFPQINFGLRFSR